MTELAVAAPALEFAILGVTPDPYAATPVLTFDARVSDDSGRDIYTIALTSQVHVDADRRAYEPEIRDSLLDLFGEADRIPQTAGSLVLARVETLVPSFNGTGMFSIAVPCSADLEQATTRYVHSLRSGVVPLTFHFSGTIFYRGENGSLQLTQVAWSSETRYRLKVSVWRELMETRHAGSGFVRLQADTFERLRQVRAERGFPTFDSAIAALLDEAARD